jgi:hypothetical protein
MRTPKEFQVSYSKFHIDGIGNLEFVI